MILQQAGEQLSTAGVSSVTGLHEPEVQEPPPLTPNTLAIVSSKEHIELLEKSELKRLPWPDCTVYLYKHVRYCDYDTCVHRR